MATHTIVSRDEWLAARVALLEKEKAFTRQRDQLATERRALPWARVEKDYLFDSPSGRRTLGELFAGRSQLFVKHFMLGPGQPRQCVGCSLEVDHVEGILTHLENHDVSYVAVARAPLAELEGLRRRMGWRVPFVSSYGSDFNYDFGVSFTPEQRAAGRGFYNFRYGDPGLDDLSGDSVFYKDEAGRIFHTYSVFSRGAEDFLGIYRILDVMPNGRDEPVQGALNDWVRPRDMYGKGGMVERNGRYHAAGCACAVHG